MTQWQEMLQNFARVDAGAGLPPMSNRFARDDDRKAYKDAYDRERDRLRNELASRAAAAVLDGRDPKDVEAGMSPEDAAARDLRQQGRADARAGLKPRTIDGSFSAPGGRFEMPEEYLESYMDEQRKMAAAADGDEEGRGMARRGEDRHGEAGLGMAGRGGGGDASAANDHRDPGDESDVAERPSKVESGHTKPADDHTNIGQRLSLHAEKIAGMHNRIVGYLARLEKVEGVMHPAVDPLPEVDRRIRAALEDRETCAAGDMARGRITVLEDRLHALTGRVDAINREPDDGPPDMVATLTGRADDHVQRIVALEKGRLESIEADNQINDRLNDHEHRLQSAETDGVANGRVKAVEDRLSRQQEQISLLLRGIRKAKKIARRAIRLLVGSSSMTDLRPPLLEQHYQDAAELRDRMRNLETAIPCQNKFQAYDFDGNVLFEGVLVQRKDTSIEIHVKKDHRPLAAEASAAEREVGDE